MHFNFSVTFVLSFLILGSIEVVTGQALSAFYSSLGPGVVTLDSVNHEFVYNFHSETGFHQMQRIQPVVLPKSSTDIAVTGYSNSMNIYASVFYQSMDNSIVQLNLKCSRVNGTCANFGELYITAKATNQASPNTRLAAVLISKDVGYRVTYEDINGTLRQFDYAQDSKGVVTPWSDGKRIGSSTVIGNGHALASTYIYKANLTTDPVPQTVYHLVGDTIQAETSFIYSNWTTRATSTARRSSKHKRDNEHTVWTSKPAIKDLPFWNPSNATFAAMNYGNSDYIFYIDMKRQLQTVRSTDGKNWTAQPRMDSTIWPLADEPNSHITAIKSTNQNDTSAYIYYTSGNKIIQARLANNTWFPFTEVEKPAPPVDSKVNGPPLPTKQNRRAMTIAVATCGSVIFVVIILTVIWCAYRRKRKNANLGNANEGMKDEETGTSSNLDYTGKAELHGESDINELDHDPECLLLHQLQLIRHHELVAGIPVEIDGTLCHCEIGENPTYEMPGCIGAKELDGGFESSQSPSGETQRSSINIPEDQLSIHPESMVTRRELPNWSWEILRREKEEMEAQNRKEREEAEELVSPI